MLKQTKIQKTYISKEDIFSKVTDKDVFRVYFGKFDFNTAYNSVFRKDENPSTGFYRSEKGKIYYNDLTTDEKYDCVSFVQKMFDLSFPETLEKIYEEVVLNPDLSNIKEAGPTTRGDGERYKFIGVGPRPFTKKDLLYWKQYSVEEKELVENNVYSVDYLLINGKHVSTGDEVKFAYVINHQGNSYVKIYSPLSTKYKVYGNVPLRVPFNYENVDQEGDVLIITKSVKDLIIWKKYYKNVIALQNESIASFDEELLKPLCDGYKRICINFDSDAPGIKAALAYKEKYEYDPIIIPEIVFTNHGVKDVSDFVKKFGILKFNKLLRLWDLT